MTWRELRRLWSSTPGPSARSSPSWAGEPRLVTARQFLRSAYGSRAQALDALRRPAEAVPDWEPTVALSPEAERLGVRLSQATSVARSGTAARTVAVAEEAARSGQLDIDRRYALACVYALASSAARRDKATQPEVYTAQAVAALREAVAAGYQDVAHLKKDSDLDPLRGRDDFKQFLAELEAKQKASPSHPLPGKGG